LPEGEGALEEPTRPPDGSSEGHLPHAADSSSGWAAGRVAALVGGVLLVLFSLILLGVGGTGLWADRTQRESGYATTGVHEFSTTGSALATVSTELGSAGVGWLYPSGLLDKIRIRVTPTRSDAPPLFVGIASSTDVDQYLAKMNHTVISEFWGNKTEEVSGSALAPPPGSQDFWVASASGSGRQTLVWDAADGSWSVVVMNANGRPGIAVGADLGAKVPALPWIALGFLVAGAIFLAGGGFLVANAVSRKRHTGHRT
jgi:hypothetical protein